MGPGDERARLHASRLGTARHSGGPGPFEPELHIIPARRHPMQVTGEPPLPLDDPLPALPASGRPHDSVTLERNQDYPADSDLCFGAGNSETRVRLTAADREAVLLALGSLVPGLAELRDRAAAMMRDALDDVDPDTAEWALRSAQLVDRAYIAGQADFSVANGRGAARDYLLGLAEDRDGKSGDMMHRDVEALERVIAMLEGK